MIRRLYGTITGLHKPGQTLNCYTEISPSGTGLRIIIEGSLEKFKQQTKDHYFLWEGHRLKAFDREHFVTITENVFRNEPIREGQPFLESLVSAGSSVSRASRNANFDFHFASIPRKTLRKNRGASGCPHGPRPGPRFHPGALQEDHALVPQGPH